MKTKFKDHLKTLLVSTALLFLTTFLSAQCAGSTNCQLCNVTATITNVQGATVVTNLSTVINSVDAGGVGIGNALELTSSGCGTITFDLELSYDWDQGGNIAWLHGLSYNSSLGWSSVQGNSPGAGWIYQNSITGCCSGAVYGEGFYFDGTNTTSNCCGGATPGNPADNYGVNCTIDCPDFTFSMEYCPNTTGSSTEAITYTLTDDGETGDWNQPAGCVFDLSFPVIINSAISQLPSSIAICDGESVSLSTGYICPTYLWSTTETSSTITVSPSVNTTYCVTTSNSVGCDIIDCVDVIVNTSTPCCTAMAGISSVLTTCSSDPIMASVLGNNTGVTYAQYLILTDVNGNIIEAITGLSGNFSAQPPGGYLMYSYNTDGANGCGLPFPPFNTNISTLETNCNNGTACGELSFTSFSVIDCCTPMAGSITSNLSIICPNGSFTATASGYNTFPPYNQAVLLIENGSIIDVSFSEIGNFTAGDCGTNYEICSYNYDNSAFIPLPGTSMSSLDCTTNCCELVCTTITTNDNQPPIFTNLSVGLIQVDCPADIPPVEVITWTDNCDGTGSLTPIETGVADCNGGTIIRIYEYIDACGNFTQYTQIIQVNAVPSSVLVNPPATITLICGDPLPPLLPLTYDNGLTGGCQDTGTINGTITDNSNGCTGLVTYNWTGADACGNVLSHTQNIVYIIPCAPNHNLNGTESGIYDYETNGIINSTQVIESTARVDYDSAIEINMNAGFEIILGAEFNAFIDGCNSGGGGVNIQEETGSY